MDLYGGVSTRWPGMFAPYHLSVGLRDIVVDKGRGMRGQNYWFVKVINRKIFE